MSGCLVSLVGGCLSPLQAQKTIDDIITCQVAVTEALARKNKIVFSGVTEKLKVMCGDSEHLSILWDSGSESHLTNDKKVYVSGSEKKCNYRVLGLSGDKVHPLNATVCGDVILPCSAHKIEGKESHILKDVLYLPSAVLGPTSDHSTVLVSVPKFVSSNNLGVSFKPDGTVELQKDDKKICKFTSSSSSLFVTDNKITSTRNRKTSNIFVNKNFFDSSSDSDTDTDSDNDNDIDNDTDDMMKTKEKLDSIEKAVLQQHNNDTEKNPKKKKSDKLKRNSKYHSQTHREKLKQRKGSKANSKDSKQRKKKI